MVLSILGQESALSAHPTSVSIMPVDEMWEISANA
jgi:hypothetical protein